MYAPIQYTYTYKPKKKLLSLGQYKNELKWLDTFYFLCFHHFELKYLHLLNYDIVEIKTQLKSN